MRLGNTCATRSIKECGRLTLVALHGDGKTEAAVVADRGEQVATMSAHKAMDRIDGDAVSGASGLKVFAQTQLGACSGVGPAEDILPGN